MRVLSLRRQPTPEYWDMVCDAGTATAHPDSRPTVTVEPMSVADPEITMEVTLHPSEDVRMMVRK